MKNDFSPNDSPLEIRMKILEENDREQRGQLNYLKNQWEQFVPAVSKELAKEVIVPALQIGLMHLQLPETLNRLAEPDPLNIDAILEGMTNKKKEKG